MEKYTYQALFTPAVEGGYTVTFPDFPCCITEGETIEEATKMAQEALSLYIRDDLHNQELSTATKAENIKHSDNEFIVPITADSLHLSAHLRAI